MAQSAFIPLFQTIFSKSVGCGPAIETSTMSAFSGHGQVCGWTYMTRRDPKHDNSIQLISNITTIITLFIPFLCMLFLVIGCSVLFCTLNGQHCYCFFFLCCLSLYSFHLSVVSLCRRYLRIGMLQIDICSCNGPWSSVVCIL